MERKGENGISPLSFLCKPMVPRCFLSETRALGENSLSLRPLGVGEREKIAGGG